MTSQTAAKRGYIPTLDGWRTVAILSVMLYHAFAQLPGWLSGVAEQYGANGVDLFFSLSGFLITSKLCSEEDDTGSISLKGFYVRRVFRLQPAALVYLSVIAVAGLVQWIPVSWSSICAAAVGMYSFTPGRYDYAHWFTNHFWSLSAEEHFYLLFPPLMLLIRRWRVAVLCVTAFVLEGWLLFVMRHKALLGWGQVFHRSDLNFSPIVLGCIAALLLRRPYVATVVRRFLRPWVAVMLAVCLWRFSQHFTNWGHFARICSYPILILSTTQHLHSALGQVLEWQPIRWVGKISYSLYLWQQFFFTSDLLQNSDSFRSRNWVCWTGTFAVATASYYLVERPAVRMGHRLGSQWTESRAELERPEGSNTLPT